VRTGGAASAGEDAAGPAGTGAQGSGERRRGVTGVGLSLDHMADTLSELGPALDGFEALGLDSVEAFLPALKVVIGARIRRAQLAEMKAACADRPFALTLHGPLALDLGDWRRAALHLDVARAMLEVGGEIGARLLVIHATIAPSLEPDAIARARAAEREALAALAPAARATGVVIGVETVYAREHEWTASPAELAETLAAVDDPAVGATVDFSHAFLNATARGYDLLESLAALAPHARHLHVHDSFGRPPAFRPWSHGDSLAFGFGDLHLPPGAGSLPWDALAALPWAGPAVANLELNRRWASEWPEAIRWTRAWIGGMAEAGAPAGGPGSAAPRTGL
jgi:sugar phosphate isomerase/epimerase